MGNVITYFSGTGNSLHAARTIAGALDNCGLEAMEPGNALPAGCERIGFVFPVFWWGLPKRVVEYVQNLDLSQNSGAYLFAVVTCGGLPGGALPQLNNLLREKGLQLGYTCSVRMVGNYVIEYNITEKAQERLQAAQAKLEEAAQDIVKKKMGRVPMGMIGAAAVNRKFLRKVADLDSNFTVSQDCTHCGTCQKVCPAQNIRIQDGKPVFLHHCENCLACLHWCPESAINYGDKTQAKKRYHHPDVSLAQMVRR